MEKLGGGSFGTVYKFKNKYGKEHALKSSKRVSFSLGINDLREVDISLRLRHPYVNQLLDYNANNVVDELSSKYTLIYPLANGTFFDLSDKINYEEEFIVYFNQLLLGLKYVHERDIILVDIKPENILYYENEDALRFNDFGISVYNDIIFRTQIAGTKYYMAPELFFEKVIYDKSDIWSLGMTFLYMLTGNLAQEDTFKDVESKQFSNSKHYKEYYLTVLNRKIYDSLLKINNQEIVSLIKMMLNVNVKERPSASDLIKLPIFKYHRKQELIIEKLFSGYPIKMLYVNTHDLRNYEKVFNILTFAYTKLYDVGEKWAWFNAVDIINYLLTIGNIDLGYPEDTIAALVLSLKIYSSDFYQIQNIKSFIKYDMEVDFGEVENSEIKIFKTLGGKIYRKNIFSFLVNLKIQFDDKFLAKYALSAIFEGELPNYALEFLSSLGIENDNDILNALANL